MRFEVELFFGEVYKEIGISIIIWIIIILIFFYYKQSSNEHSYHCINAPVINYFSKDTGGGGSF